jgi:hypothetical protein
MEKLEVIEMRKTVYRDNFYKIEKKVTENEKEAEEEKKRTTMSIEEFIIMGCKCTG